MQCYNRKCALGSKNDELILRTAITKYQKYDGYSSYIENEQRHHKYRSIKILFGEKL